MSRVRPFSHGYYILEGIQVIEWPRDYITVPHDLNDKFLLHVQEPFLKIGAEHYAPRSERGVPADTVVVPESADFKEKDGILLAKDTKARNLMVEE